jgi:hypothetical protein
MVICNVITGRRLGCDQQSNLMGLVARKPATLTLLHSLGGMNGIDIAILAMDKRAFLSWANLAKEVP